MGDEEATIPVYLDQNIYSGVRDGMPHREELLGIFEDMASKGANFVYSKPHIEECRASESPVTFVEAIEKISAYWLDPADVDKILLELCPNRARELICAEWDFAECAERLMYSILQIIQFSAGWLGEHEAENLRIDLEEEVDAALASWEQHDPDLYEMFAPRMKEQIVEIIRRMDLRRIKDQAQHDQAKLRARLPQNYAQLDEMPNEEVIEYLMSCLDSDARNEVLKQFPRGFWSDIPQREEGALASFTFMLFMMGLTREKKVKSKQIHNRKKHFLGQFRDCRHIEIASRCAIFITLDKGAARLAGAAYAYAGVKTKVIHLEEKGEPSRPPLSQP